MSMKKIWRVLKYILSIGLLLFIVLVGVGWYSYHENETARKNSAFIQSLERTEQNHGDVIKLLFEGLTKVDDKDAQLVTAWLKKRQNRGEQPYLYLIGIYSGLQSNQRSKLHGLEYLAKAALVYRVDAAKCGDPSANQAVPILESSLGVNLIRNNLKNHPEMRKKIILSALDYEEKSYPRPAPLWICAHGMGYGNPAPGENDFQAHRQKTRAQFESWF
ncbi:hypothetical protein SAMN04489760_102159 [Syntrophus gentianae]|uniref:Uncharacterized protein n=1 Tax=Syntrophus gentianae TaxID=43775 RepID=A0A1H7UX14_9BACT|nr:hypothetical protein [Syntrophus gentianae]SEM01384.1 hypothetical protein SAMN04489760_102159 [Syntrophus gentianae]